MGKHFELFHPLEEQIARSEGLTAHNERTRHESRFQVALHGDMAKEVPDDSAIEPCPFVCVDLKGRAVLDVRQPKGQPASQIGIRNEAESLTCSRNATEHLGPNGRILVTVQPFDLL